MKAISWLILWGALGTLTALGAEADDDFRFEGNTVFTSRQLAEVLQSFKGRRLTADEREEARRVLTMHYVEKGYINSGAIMVSSPDSDGPVLFRIIEGRLSDIKLTGNKWLRDGYITGRIRSAAGEPLSIVQLREGLAMLRQNANIEQINAELQPGLRPGEGVLQVAVSEQQPFSAELQFDNYRPPSSGAYELALTVADRNLTGNSDPLVFTYDIARGALDDFDFSGADNFSGSYAAPVTVFDTTLKVFGQKRDYAIIEDPFNALEIESEFYTLGVGIRQPLFRTTRREFAVGLTFERAHSESTLLGVPFNVSPGAVNGELDTSVLRFTQDWTDRGMNHVLALRSTFNFGLDAFEATDNGTARDATFFSWLGQAQHVHRLFGSSSQIILRVDGLWTNDELLSMEQFSVGGAHSVRGYRENTLVRDTGVLGSVEFRLPVLVGKSGKSIVELAPFFDFGGAWNSTGSTPSPKTISSAGIGILLTPCKWVSGQLYWGYAFRDIETSGNDAQDDGLHFRVTIHAR